MPRILATDSYSLDFDELYARMWEIATDDQHDGTRLFRPDSQSALKWLIAELSGTPAVPGKTRRDNNLLREQAHAALEDGWAERITETSFRLLRPPVQSDKYALLHDLMSVIPTGRWTTYGELGSLVEIHPIGLGSHIKNCRDCPNAVRVLQARGQFHGPGFRWSDESQANMDPNEVLRQEGVVTTGGRAARAQFVDGAELSDLLAASAVPRFQWPTIEWVKVPVDRETGEPNGSPIRARHFLDCSHWYRDDEGNLLGAPPILATSRQMHELEACKDCATKAAAASNPEVGPRLTDVPEASLSSESALSPSTWFTPELTDDIAMTAIRREQQHLRKHLLAQRSEAPCALCGRTLPKGVLVAAHIAPRHALNEAERLDFASAAMLACSLGCDSLFERGYVAIDDTGHIVEHLRVDNDALNKAVTMLVGREVPAFTSLTAPRFAQHRALHSRP